MQNRLLLFRRLRRANRWSDLSPKEKARLLEEINDMRANEERAQALLRLAIRPRLSLIDEETSSLITGMDREAIEADGNS